MTKTKDNKPGEDVIMCTDETGVQLYLSEKAANRLSWIMTGICDPNCDTGSISLRWKEGQ